MAKSQFERVSCYGNQSFFGQFALGSAFLAVRRKESIYTKENFPTRSYEKNYSTSSVNLKESNDRSIKATISVNSSNYLIIRKGSRNQYYEEIIAVTSEENYLIKSNVRKENIPFDGIISVIDWNDDIVKGYLYKNGELKGNLVDNKSGRVLRVVCLDYQCYCYFCVCLNQKCI